MQDTYRMIRAAYNSASPETRAGCSPTVSRCGGGVGVHVIPQVPGPALPSCKQH